MHNSVRVGIVGLGFMGRQHLGVYFANPKAELVAVSDTNPDRLNGNWSDSLGNIEDHSGGVIDLRGVAKYSNYQHMLDDPNVEVVDITLPTPLHAQHAIRALEAKKHVLCEKPMALTLKECDAMIAAAKANRRKLMIAHCIRFWPEFALVRDLILKKKLGKVHAAHFRRYAPMPQWSWKCWLLNAKQSGSAVLDLHIHDVDYINSVFGKPLAVTAQGVPEFQGYGFRHIACLYEVASGALVTAEGGWDLPPGCPFEMSFTITMERAVLKYSSLAKPALVAYGYDGSIEPLAVSDKDGFWHEIDYFLDTIIHGISVQRASAKDARLAVEVCFAEMESARKGKTIRLR